MNAIDCASCQCTGSNQNYWLLLFFPWSSIVCIWFCLESHVKGIYFRNPWSPNTEDGTAIIFERNTSIVSAKHYLAHSEKGSSVTVLFLVTLIDNRNGFVSGKQWISVILRTFDDELDLKKDELQDCDALGHGKDSANWHHSRGCINQSET